MSKATINYNQLSDYDKQRYITEQLTIGMCAKLEGMSELIAVPTWALARAYNGCGPQWMSDEWRAKLSEFLHIFIPAFIRHDWLFTAADGSISRFADANVELEANCIKLADYHYAWYNWRRYRARAAAKTIYHLCCIFGWSAWRDAAKAHDTTISGECPEACGEGENNAVAPSPSPQA